MTTINIIFSLIGGLLGISFPLIIGLLLKRNSQSKTRTAISWIFITLGVMGILGYIMNFVFNLNN
jgi:D-alanyl-lipoteichoic acid acyltransferase DltB (MBOAT superfamily)